MNLIICCTPLQVIIAKKIIELHPNEQFFGLMLYPISNDKYYYYANELQNSTQYFFKLKNYYLNIRSIGKWLRNYLIVKHIFLNKKFNKVFLANIDDLIISSLITTIDFLEIYTFDDGTKNISKINNFYGIDKSKNLRRIFYMVFGLKYSIEKIKSLSKIHYTIYRDQENIIKDTYYLDLFGHNIPKNNYQKNIKLMLGQPIFDNKKKNIEITNLIVKNFSIDYYLPHPRENYHIKGVHYINTPMIVEDYVLSNIHTRFHIYSFASSALINMINFDNVVLNAIYIDNKDNKGFMDVYSILSSLNIRLINIDEF